MIQLRSRPDNGANFPPRKERDILYLTADQLRVANRLARKTGFARQLDDTFIGSLSPRGRYLIASAERTLEGAYRCVVLIDSSGHEVTIDVDPLLYDALDDAPIPQPEHSRN